MPDAPILDGNAAQVRLIIEQTIASLEASRGKQKASWASWLGIGLGLGGLVFSAGMLRSDVATANTRLDKLEQRADAADRTATSVNDRLARIETKLDLALEKRR
ncbi:hypothetical protein [Sphingopyxis sp. 113P3]|uniref:hypothetical protein n=1 Tax=Sphingopyxis sp. (strain 113P3) TaxID=292913 RepID=UPI0006AD3CBE|nr:hypothetical protein [Sphingopyxis sp. 113P3]ALC11203.1 hypothetical protein LH20_04480 [Sphingopyxis sp. 113P3]